MHYSIEIDLVKEVNISAEVEVFFDPADRNTDASDWDYQDYWAITNYTVFSKGKEIDLELDTDFLYDKVKQKIKEREIDLDLQDDFGGF